MVATHLHKIFQPEAIAVIGATTRPGAVGNTVLNNLLNAEYPGTIYPVNPGRSEVLGLPAFHDVADIPAPPDLAVVCTPAATTPGILKACGRAGVGGVIILSAGCREAGATGQEIETQLRVEAARWPRMRIIGPNCLGVLSPRARLNASFAPAMPLAGSVALISQSGALCSSILDWSLTANVGFSHVASVGNAIDVEFSDLISYFADDPHTTSIVMYVESINRGSAFLSAARAFTRVKPIVVYKAGRFAASAQAAASHTGAMAGADAAYEVAFHRAGAVRVDEATDLFDCTALLATSRLPKGPRLAIVTNAGGPGVMATDSLLSHGGELAPLSAQTLQRLRDALPPYSSCGNPVDVLGDADPERFVQAVSVVLHAAEVDAVLVILTPQAMTDPTVTARRIASLQASAAKPVMAVWMGGDAVRGGRQLLAAAGVATFDSPDRAVRALTYLSRSDRPMESIISSATQAATLAVGNRQTARALIESLTDDAVRVLSEEQSKTLLAYYGLATTVPRLARSSREAEAIAEQIGYPVVMKIDSPDITHKSDVGGVEIDVTSRPGTRAAYDRIIDSVHLHAPRARIDGVTIQPMAASSDGIELILGTKRDRVFGPLVMVGAGGVAAEVLGDCAFELPPLTRRLAQRMLQSLRIWPLLRGYRGKPGADVDGVIDALMRLSEFAVDNSEVLEVDANPVLATPSSVIVLDARVVLQRQGDRSSTPLTHDARCA